MTSKLTAAVENAYRVFRRYSLGGRIVVCNCNCCVHPDIEKRLIGTPLREVSNDLLAEYTNSAHGYDTDKIANDFRYFLPRYFELIAAGELPTSNYEEVMLRRLGDANYAATWRPMKSRRSTVTSSPCSPPCLHRRSASSATRAPA